MFRFRLPATLVGFATVAVLAACSSESPLSPSTAIATPSAPTSLIAVGDGSFHILSEQYIGTNFMSEYELGAALLGEEYQGSVFIRVSVPQVTSPTAGSSLPCITSTIIKTEVRPGWAASVKKAGGCDKPIEIAFENAKTKQRATFKWTYIFGLTKVDHGAVR